MNSRDKLTMTVSKEAFRNWYEDRMRSRKLFPKVKDGQFRVILHVGIFYNYEIFIYEIHLKYEGLRIEK